MRKYLFGVVMLSVCIGLGGCGTKDHQQISTQTQITESEQESDSNDIEENVDDKNAAEEMIDDTNKKDVKVEVEESSSEEGKEPEIKEQENITVDIADAPEKIDRSEAFALLAKMNVGWNLGNTFDAHGKGHSLSAETCWGNPKTTKEMIDTVAAKGFNTIRIPVTWAEHVSGAPDYTIDEDWINRVEEVVGYALDNDMYVILNTHHETDFWLKPKEENMEAIKEELSSLWTQIAEHFKDYDEHLIFEGMNEPRNKGTAAEWNGGTGKERLLIDELNAVFVDAVRQVGGKNENRLLIICGYGTSANAIAIKNLVIPEDPYIAVAVHMYTPYVFTYEAGSGNLTTWSGNKKSDITSTVSTVNRYLMKEGVPAIITEFGAVNKDNTEEVVKWLEDYMGAMNEYGLKCIWWDNGNFSSSGEKFGLLDRRNLKWYSPEVVDALINNAVSE